MFNCFFFSENGFVNSVVMVALSISEENFLSNLLAHVLSSVVVIISSFDFFLFCSS